MNLILATNVSLVVALNNKIVKFTPHGIEMPSNQEIKEFTNSRFSS